MKNRFTINGLIATFPLFLGFILAGSFNATAAPVTNGSIPVANASFEANNANAPDDWTFTPGVVGEYSTAYVRASDQFVQAPNGNNTVELDDYPYGDFGAGYGKTYNTGTLSQTLSLTDYVPKVGDSLSLVVAGAVGQTGNLAPSEELALTLGGFIIASATYDFPQPSIYPETLPDYTLPTYTITSADLLAHPGALGIEIIATNTQAQFDNVRLTVEGAAAVPEPSTWALMFGSALGLFAWQRTRRSA